MVEAMVAVTLVDAIMCQKAQCELFPNDSPQEELPNPLGSTARRVGGKAKPKGEGVVNLKVNEE